MNNQRIVFTMIAVVSGVLCAHPVEGQHFNIGLQFFSPSFVSIQANKSSFSLHFDDFKRGSLSDVEKVQYLVIANDVQISKGVVTGRLDDSFKRINLQGRLFSYHNIAGNAKLVKAFNGWKVIKHNKDQNLVNKQRIRGRGNVLFGTMTLGYRARAKQYLWSKRESRNLTITLVDT